MKVKLKSCPFCGKQKFKFISESKLCGFILKGFIKCKYCEACSPSWISFSHKTLKADLIKQWNKRAGEK